jgi:tetratricopeptide (TPR) repeat protein
MSYLALGEISFAQQDYLRAGAYYDSTMMFLPKEAKNYNEINEKKKSLSTLVRYINIVEREDSLQKVVTLYGGDTTTLYAYIDKKIAEAKKEEERKKKELEDKMNNGGSGNNILVNNQNNQNNQNQGGAQWYFYNQSTIGFGVNEFTRKWGNRKLEDNWRRANKETFIEEESGDDKKDTSAVKSGKLASNQTREYYLKDLPMTPEKIEKSNELIADAYYNLGSIYKDQLNNLPKAAETFELLCSRFPKHKYALQSHFQLYRIYQKTGDKAKEKIHSDYICTNHPASDYCQLITNPEHESQVLAEREKVRIYYDSTLVQYERRNFPVVVSRCNYADSTFGTKHEHAAKFAYLRALSYGKTQGTPQMESALVKLIDTYPKDPIKAEAQKMLDFLRKTNGKGGVIKSDTSATKSGYTTNDKVEFQYMVVVQTGKGDINKFKTALSDFNTANYSSARLEITSMVIDATRQIILVKKFADQKGAMSYYNNLNAHPELFAWLNAGTYTPMVISSENFGNFFRTKDVDGYTKFFNDNILKKK